MKKFLTVVAVIVLLVAIVVGVGQWMNSSNQSGPSRGGGGSQSAAPSKEGVENPPECVGYEVIAAPGTWESAADDDPMNPTANPRSLLLSITKPLQEQTNPEDVKVWTLPYTAQFRNINAQHEKSYDDSRDEGTAKIREEMTQTHQACPATKFVLVGFSQGAVIAGDLANEIGTGNGVIPADRVAGVALIADGRMEVGVGELVGSKRVTGQGAEISLNPVSGLIQPIVPGASMRGPRPGGFGELDDRVKNFCAVDDTICDAPSNLGDAFKRAHELISANGVHAQYATNGKVVQGHTVPEWIVGWALDLTSQPL